MRQGSAVVGMKVDLHCAHLAMRQDGEERQGYSIPVDKVNGHMGS